MILIGLKLSAVTVIGLFWYCIFWKAKSFIRGKEVLCIALIAVVVAFSVSEALPRLKDEISLRALGERNEEAQAEEIILSGFMIDGEKIPVPKSLTGEWFWSGNYYVWRAKNDSRQPQGITEHVKFAIPVGRNRTVNFISDIWSGKVEIICNNESVIVDTYAKGYQETAIELAPSRSTKLLLNMAWDISGFVGIWFVAMFIGIWICKNFMHSGKYNVKSKMLYGSFAIAIFALMFHYSEMTSLWCDELGQIGWSNGSIKEAIHYCLNMNDATPPLFAICAAFWYRVVPYGEKWLLLLTVIPTVASIYLIGLAGEKIHGRYCGVLACIFMAFSYPVWVNSAYEFRSYAFVLFFTTLSFYFFISRNKALLEGSKRKYAVAFSLALIGMIMSHYFGFLVCGAFFLADCYLTMRDKVKKKFFCYLPVAFVGMGWLTAVFLQTLLSRPLSAIANWYPVPGFSQVKELLLFLSGSSDLYYKVSIFSIGAALISVFKTRCRCHHILFYHLFSVFVPIFVIGTVAIYGNFHTSSTMWEHRYFLLLLPFLCMSAAICVAIASGYLSELMKKHTMVTRAICMFFALTLSLDCLDIVSSSRSWQPYREAAEWLYSQSNYIFNANTLVMVSPASSILMEGWNDYYITHKGERASVGNIGSSDQMTAEDILAHERIYLQYSQSAAEPWVEQILNEHYVVEADMSSIQMRIYVRV